MNSAMNRTVRATVEIDAPREHVWSVLVDFDRYAEWNPFTPRVGLASFRIGEKVALDVRMGRFRRVMNEELRAYDEGRRIGWGVSIGRGLLVEATRYQDLEDAGEGRTRYTTHETFEGALAPLTLLLFGRDVEAGFRACADALKARAEALLDAR